MKCLSWCAGVQRASRLISSSASGVSDSSSLPSLEASISRRRRVPFFSRGTLAAAGRFVVR